MRDCYEYLTQLCGDDRHMFDASAIDTLSKPPHQIETWLIMVEALIKQNKKENLEGKQHKRLKEHYKQLPMQNQRIRALAKKCTKDQNIMKFLRPKADVRAESH